MTIHKGLTTEELQTIEKEALSMHIENARVHLREKSAFSQWILDAWIDDLVKKHPESLMAITRRVKRPPAPE